MNKKFVLFVLLGGLGIVLLSFGVKNLVTQKGAHTVEKHNQKSLESLQELAHGYEADRDFVKAKTVLREVVERFPDTDDAKAAERKLEKLNLSLIFSNMPTDDSFSYVIQPGDTLSKIASKNNTTVELLKKANGLESDIIRPGRTLKVIATEFNILVDRSANVLFLKNDSGEILKKYAVSTGKDFSTPLGTFEIEEKMVKPVWYKVGAIVEPDSNEYELGARWMGLSVEGYGIHGTSDESTIGRHITKGCVRMRNGDVVELYSLVPSGTKVTIVE